MTAPGHFIVGGLEGSQGVVLSRDADVVDHKFELSESHWYIAMTNTDVWQHTDLRYEKAMAYMAELGQHNIDTDGKSIIESVLWQDGVLLPLTIFSSTISAYPDTPMAIFDAPSYTLQPPEAEPAELGLYLTESIQTM